MTSHVSDTWQAMGLTHDKPCVKMHVFIRHMANHVSTCMECQLMYKWVVFVEGKEKREGEKERKGKEKRKREKKEKKGKGKEKEKEKGGRWFLHQFISVLMVGTRWTKE